MKNNQLFFATDRSSIKRFCYIDSMGIHEKMAPHRFKYKTDKNQYLLILMHDEINTNPKSDIKSQRYAVLYTPECIREYGSATQPWDHSWILLCGESIKFLIDRINFPCNEKFAICDNQMTERSMEILYQELVTKSDQIESIIEAMFYVILTELQAERRSDNLMIATPLVKAKDYMMNNFSKPLSVREIAQQAAFSVSHFIPLFKKYYHTSPINWLNHYRIQMAIQMLRIKEYSCKEISEATGFRDQLYFSRCFKKQLGMSPSQYREKNL